MRPLPPFISRTVPDSPGGRYRQHLGGGGRAVSGDLPPPPLPMGHRRQHFLFPLRNHASGRGVAGGRLVERRRRR